MERVDMSCVCLPTGLADNIPLYLAKSDIFFPLVFRIETECYELFYIDGEGPVHYGVCSNYLRDANEGDDINLFVRR